MQNKTLWVRIKGQANMGGTVMGVHYYRPPDQEEEVNEAFYRQLEVASRSQAFCDGMAGWVDEGKAVDVAFLDPSKAFDTVSCG